MSSAVYKNCSLFYKGHEVFTHASMHILYIKTQMNLYQKYKISQIQKIILDLHYFIVYEQLTTLQSYTYFIFDIIFPHR